MVRNRSVKDNYLSAKKNVDKGGALLTCIVLPTSICLHSDFIQYTFYKMLPKSCFAYIAVSHYVLEVNTAPIVEAN